MAQPQTGPRLTKSTTSLHTQGTTVGGYEGDKPSYRCPQVPRVHNHPSSGGYCTTVTLSTLLTAMQGPPWQRSMGRAASGIIPERAQLRGEGCFTTYVLRRFARRATQPLSWEFSFLPSWRASSLRPEMMRRGRDEGSSRENLRRGLVANHRSRSSSPSGGEK